MITTKIRLWPWQNRQVLFLEEQKAKTNNDNIKEGASRYIPPLAIISVYSFYAAFILKRVESTEINNPFLSSPTRRTMARFYDGKTWTDVLPEKPAERKKRKNPLSYFRRRSKLSSSNNKDETPVAPVLNGNENILVTIPSFRGTHETALHPGTKWGLRETSYFLIRENTHALFVVFLILSNGFLPNY